MLLQVFVILFFAGVGTAAQNLAPRPPVAAPASRAVPPYKYASSVRSPHPAVQPLQVTKGLGSEVPAVTAVQQALCATQVFSQKLQAFITQTRIIIWNLKTWQLYLCQGQASWFICLVLASPFLPRFAVRIFFLVICFPVLQPFILSPLCPILTRVSLKERFASLTNLCAVKKQAWMLLFLSCGICLTMFDPVFVRYLQCLCVTLGGFEFRTWREPIREPRAPYLSFSET